MATKLPWIFVCNTTSSYFGWYKRCVMPETMNALCLIRFWNLGPISVFCFHILNKSVLGRRKKCGDSPLTYKIILIWQPPRPRLREHWAQFKLLFLYNLFWKGIFEHWWARESFQQISSCKEFHRILNVEQMTRKQGWEFALWFFVRIARFWERKSVFPTLRASVCN